MRYVFVPSVVNGRLSPPTPMTPLVQPPVTCTKLLHVPVQTEIMVSKLLPAVLTIKCLPFVPTVGFTCQMASRPPTPQEALGTELVNLLRSTDRLNIALAKGFPELGNTTDSAV